MILSSGACLYNRTIENLSFNYYSIPNELQNVTDSGISSTGLKENSSRSTTYANDANGNMISDVEKGITSISYNRLNLPARLILLPNQLNLHMMQMVI